MVQERLAFSNLFSDMPSFSRLELDKINVLTFDWPYPQPALQRHRFQRSFEIF